MKLYHLSFLIMLFIINSLFSAPSNAAGRFLRPDLHKLPLSQNIVRNFASVLNHELKETVTCLPPHTIRMIETHLHKALNDPNLQEKIALPKKLIEEFGDHYSNRGPCDALEEITSIANMIDILTNPNHFHFISLNGNHLDSDKKDPSILFRVILKTNNIAELTNTAWTSNTFANFFALKPFTEGQTVMNQTAEPLFSVPKESIVRALFLKDVPFALLDNAHSITN